MVRRRKKKSPVKYKSAFNIRSFGKAAIQLSIGTKAIFNTNAPEFFLGGFVPGYKGTAQGQSQITAYELVNWTEGKAYSATSSYGSSIVDTVVYNLKNNAGAAIMQTIGLKVGDKVAQKLGVYRSFNKLVRSVGLGDLVKM
jgi:hypothetical protein